jgi:hypothetical protein
MDHLCLLDESESGRGVLDPFFVYGAILIPSSRVGRLHTRILAIREETGIPNDVALKWNMPAVDGVTADRLLEAKRSVLRATGDNHGELFVSIVRKEIAAGRRTGGDAHLYGANTVLPAIGEALAERSGMALFLFDRLPSTSLNDAFDYLGRRMSHGLGRLDKPPSLAHAIGFGFVDCNSIRLGSSLDLCLGAFTRCLNERGTELVDTVAAAVIPQIAKNSAGRVWERGVMMRPVIVKIAKYGPSYARVYARLGELGLR